MSPEDAQAWTVIVVGIIGALFAGMKGLQHIHGKWHVYCRSGCCGVEGEGGNEECNEHIVLSD